MMVETDTTVEASGPAEAQRRVQRRELETWRGWLPGWREAIAAAEDEATLAGEALGAVLAERDRLLAEFARLAAVPRPGVAYGQGTVQVAAGPTPAMRALMQRVEAIQEPPGEAAGGAAFQATRRQNAATQHLALLRRRCAGLEQQIRERADALGVSHTLAPGERSDPPPAAAPVGATVFNRSPWLGSDPPPPAPAAMPPPVASVPEPIAGQDLRARIAAGLARLGGAGEG